MATFDAYPVLDAGGSWEPSPFGLIPPCHWHGEASGLVLPYCPPRPVNRHEPALGWPIIAELGTGAPWVGGERIDLVGTPADRSELRLERLAIAWVLTDARADVDDELPFDGAELRGFWADTIDPDKPENNGSRWWLLERAILTGETAERAREYLLEAFGKWIELGLAEAVDAEVERTHRDRLEAVLLITEPGRSEPTELKFPWLWEAIRA